MRLSYFLIGLSLLLVVVADRGGRHDKNDQRPPPPPKSTPAPKPPQPPKGQHHDEAYNGTQRLNLHNRTDNDGDGHHKPPDGHHDFEHRSNEMNSKSKSQEGQEALAQSLRDSDRPHGPPGAPGAPKPAPSLPPSKTFEQGHKDGRPDLAFITSIKLSPANRTNDKDNQGHDAGGPDNHKH